MVQRIPALRRASFTFTPHHSHSHLMSLNDRVATRPFGDHARVLPSPFLQLWIRSTASRMSTQRPRSFEQAWHSWAARPSYRQEMHLVVHPGRHTCLRASPLIVDCQGRQLSNHLKSAQGTYPALSHDAAIGACALGCSRTFCCRCRVVAAAIIADAKVMAPGQVVYDLVD